MEINFPKLEKGILRFWRENRTFEKSVKKRAKTRNFIFFEGPPTANGRPGIHHVLSRIYKDIICRYKTMQGYRVVRKAGWDTHGLPVELEIEKKLGLKSKKDIEKYGIAKFNKLCKQSVWAYLQDWEKLTERIAFWLDMENPYITYENYYMETIWWIIKQLQQKGLLYQGYKVVPYCPRCGTSLSSHEVALGYEKIKESAIYIKFKIKPDTYLLVWTTTPWTLPANVAVAVNPNFIYNKVKVGGEYLIVAKERIEAAGVNGEVVEEFKGKDLVGLRYAPLFPIIKNSRALEHGSKIYEVIGADFVSLEEGTGLVHIAPAFGEEDMEVGKEKNLPVLMTVDETGCFAPEVKQWRGMFVKKADPLIVEDLKKRNLLFKEELYEHDYPFCWRCSSPLLYYAKKSWFINVQKVKENLIRNNQKINWVPAHLKRGRFGEWLKEVKDWAFSRERYWGTPLPVWKCQKCEKLEVIGSRKDLLSQKFSTNQYYILRHGHSLRQIRKIASCWPEKNPLPLTKTGEKEVKKVAKKLKTKKIDLIFSSDLLRTKQTAEIIAKETGGKIIFDKRLREYNIGIFNGKPPQSSWEYLKKKKDWLGAKIPKGESLVELRKRMYRFLEEVNKKYQGMNILIVSHELPLTILEGALRAHALEKLLELRREKKIRTIKTAELRKIEFKSLPFNEKMALDFHRPYIDEVKFYCPKCKAGLMERVPEVIDCWFDSGSMPFAQYHYPFENKDLIDPSTGSGQAVQFPADYISEAIDQTRGWFYTLHVISTLIKNSPAYKNVISLGHVLDEKGEKMSKSKGNVVDPWDIVEKYGADATRWYFYTVNQPGDAKLFAERDVDLAFKKFILTFWNSFVFFETYREKSKVKSQKSKNILDRWIVSKLNNLVGEVTQRMEKYDVTGAARVIENFVIEDLSQWYIRRSRKRFDEAAGTLSFVLLTLSKLSAPFIPFLSEYIYKELIGESPQQSVHLADWPKANKKLIDKKLENSMKEIRELITLALAERAKAGIKVRQPLALLKIQGTKPQMRNNKELLNLVRDEVNVKEVVFDPKIKQEVELDTKITPELKEEGMVREIVRNIQEMRKKAGLKPKDKIKVRASGESEKLNKILTRNKKFILKEAKVKDFVLGERPKQVFDVERELKVDQQILWLAIKKI